MSEDSEYLRNERGPSDAAGIIGISVALGIAILAGFLVGSVQLASELMPSEICSDGLAIEQCSALRSAIAAEDTALIAKWMLWVTTAALLASNLALLALFLTYKQGQRALRVAQDANTVSERNGHAQARAYLVLEEVSARLQPHTNKVGSAFLLYEPVFFNSGMSPALRVRHSCQAKLLLVFGEDSRETVVVGADFDPSLSHWQKDVPAGQSRPDREGLELPKSDTDYQSLFELAQFIAVTIRLKFEYLDVFGHQHCEVACFQGRIKSVSSSQPLNKLNRGPDDAFEKIQPASPENEEDDDLHN